MKRRTALANGSTSAGQEAAKVAWYRSFDCAMGPLWLAVDPDGGAVAVGWEDETELRDSLHARGFVAHRDAGGDGAASTAAAAGLDAMVAAFDSYFRSGYMPAVRLGALATTTFRAAVLEALAALGPGELTTYGQLARRVGAVPSAARAVGGAVGSNPLPILIPCHRVLQGDGSLGGFSGGLDRKRWLLRHEGLGWRGADGDRAAVRSQIGRVGTTDAGPV